MLATITPWQIAQWCVVAVLLPCIALFVADMYMMIKTRLGRK